MYEKYIKQFAFILGEGSVYERLRRCAAVEIDPHIAYASLIYEDEIRRVLSEVHREYLDIGQRFGIPMIAVAPTWRANYQRIARSDFAELPVNRDCVRFMIDLRNGYGPNAHPILIGGNCGPKGDGYLPDEAPEAQEAEQFHQPQISDLAESGVDFLIAKTLPAFGEALGIARCMALTELPYVISFVLRADGTILDGTPLDEAIQRIDREASRPPTHYNVNCVHASIFSSALNAIKSRNSPAFTRIRGLDANTSAKTPEELEGLEEIDPEAPEDFGENLWALHKSFDTVYLGGCCGSSTEHIEALAQRAM